MKYKILPMYQPWATLLAHWIKKIETRPKWTSWTIEKGGYLIYACKEWKKVQKEFCLIEPFYSNLKKIYYKSWEFKEKFPIDKLDFDFHIINNEFILPFGCLIGAIDIVECLEICNNENIWIFPEKSYNRNFAIRIKEPELSYGDYSNGRYAWITKNPRILKTPIQYTGMQGYYHDFKGNVNDLIFKP